MLRCQLYKLRNVTDILGTFEKELSSRMHKLLEQTLFLNTIPRTLVQIVLQAQGNTGIPSHRLAVSYLNAMSAALHYTGCVATRGVFCAVLISRRSWGDLVVNCELEDCEDVGTLGFLFSNEHKDGELVWSDWHVKFNRTIFTDVVVAGQAGARETYDCFRNQIAF